MKHTARWALMTTCFSPYVDDKPVAIYTKQNGREYIEGWEYFDVYLARGATFKELVLKEEADGAIDDLKATIRHKNGIITRHLQALGETWEEQDEKAQ